MTLSRTKYFIACVLFSTATAAVAGAPVEYGGNADLDACPSLGHVGNLGPGKDEFLAVKDASDLKATRVDKLSSGQQVWICAETKDWLGVVYDKSGKLDCGTSKSIANKRAYVGPCKSGWVAARWVVLDAG